MERTMSVEDKIRRAEEIYYRRREQEVPERKLTQITSDNNIKISIKLVKKMIKQIIGCLAIYAVVYAVVNNNYVFSEDFTNKAREILNQDIDFKAVYFVVSTKLQEIENGLNKKEESTKEHQDKEPQNQEQGQEQQSDNVEEVKNENTSSEVVQNEEGNIEENIEEKNIGGANIQENGDNLVENNEVELSQMEKDAKYIKETVNFIKPINGKISSGFGVRNPTTASVPKNHTGTDIAANTGTKILSATDGNVILASSTGDYGNHLKIQVGDVIVVYAHCNALYVKQGENVKQGQEIAEVGATGNATGPHLHFEIRYQDRYVNPQLIMEL